MIWAADSHPRAGDMDRSGSPEAAGLRSFHHVFLHKLSMLGNLSRSHGVKLFVNVPHFVLKDILKSTHNICNNA